MFWTENFCPNFLTFICLFENLKIVKIFIRFYCFYERLSFIIGGVLASVTTNFRLYWNSKLRLKSLGIVWRCERLPITGWDFCHKYWIVYPVRREEGWEAGRRNPSEMVSSDYLLRRTSVILIILNCQQQQPQSDPGNITSTVLQWALSSPDWIQRY